MFEHERGHTIAACPGPVRGYGRTPRTPPATVRVESFVYSSREPDPSDKWLPLIKPPTINGPMFHFPLCSPTDKFNDCKTLLVSNRLVSWEKSNLALHVKKLKTALMVYKIKHSPI